MKNYFVLFFLLFIGLEISAQILNPEDSKSSVLEKLHRIIERSDMIKVRREFQEICQSNQFPSIVSGLNDGKYQGATPEDDYGYRHEVSFEMKAGKMISIQYNEIHKDGHAKLHNEDYCKRMIQSGTTPDIAYPSYENQMLRKQDSAQIDAVSGASYSLYRFRLSILYAILNSGQL